MNFVTCHDGFTLNDLVSYNEKHNERNQEGNRDGMNDNRSWNCGTEGSTDDPAIEILRNRQVKNFFAATVLSLGLPMISMGDEVRRTQLGNNNAYCQDNETSWFDWTLIEKHADVLRFVTLLNARRSWRNSGPDHRCASLNQVLRQASRTWHGIKLGQRDWSDSSHTLAFTAEAPDKKIVFHAILNAYWEALECLSCRGQAETSADQGTRGGAGSTPRSTRLPDDIVEWEAAPTVSRADLSGWTTIGGHAFHRYRGWVRFKFFSLTAI